MNNQLVKRNPVEGYKNVFPKTFIDAIKDRESGASLEEILQGFNMYFLSYNGSKTLTRCRVPRSLRKEGLWITYVLYDHTVVTEWYNSDNIDDESWGRDSNWRIASNALVGDISISTDGYWIINGTTTNIKAQGETGITPLLRFGDNNKFQVSYNEGKGWEDISGDITNNLKISKYIGINDSLPTSGIAEGTIYMKGPYYDENDTNNDNPIYRMWVYAWKGNTLAWQDNGEFTSISAGVVQERGTSTTQVMSQDAVTRELTELESEDESIRKLSEQAEYKADLTSQIVTPIDEDVFVVTDSEGNVAVRYNENGLDAAKVSQHMKDLYKDGTITEIEESAFMVADHDANIAMKYDKDGFDVAKVSQHMVEMLDDAKLVGSAEVVEDGFFIVDSALNIGLGIDSKGTHSKNLVEI